MYWQYFNFLAVGLCVIFTKYDIVTVYLQYIQPQLDVPTTIYIDTDSPTSHLVVTHSQPTSTTISYEGPYKFNQTFAILILLLHNIKRSIHGVHNLTWNSSLFEYASKMTQLYDCSGILSHLGGPDGENLALGYTVEGAIDAWYSEGKLYDYKHGGDGVYNHFTQLIWNSSTSLGCATSFCNNVWGNYIVCEYYPPGNVIGQSSRNVFPPL